MKKIFLMFVIFFSVMAISGAEIFYSNGKSVAVEKSDDFSAVKSDAAQAAPKDALYMLNLGKTVFSFINGKNGELPVYFFGGIPVVAEKKVFWKGEKSVEYMEKKYGMKLSEILPSYPLHAFTVQGDSVETAEKIVKNGDGYAFPDIVRETTLRFVPEKAPKDPYFNMQWHLQNTGEVLDYYGSKASIMKNADTRFIQMLEFLNANEIEVSTDTKVAIMDTGIVPDHEDLTNIEEGYDAINDKAGGHPDLSELDQYAGSPYISYIAAAVGHGTTCAGVSAGVGNETGMSGMCPWCKLYPVRYLEGIAGTALSEDVMLKVYEKYVADPDISVVNCSFGAQYSDQISQIPISPAEIESHTNFMEKGRGGKGGVIVYASGNDGINSVYEELLGYEFTFKRNGTQVTGKVVTVNASTAWDTLAEYSNYGPYSTVAAPSLSEVPMIGIATTSIPGYGDYKSDYTILFSGTSAAAPVVSGLFGAVFSINPELTLEEAVEILRKSADKINPETGLWDDKGFSIKYGYGRVNLDKAARLAAGYPMCEGEKDEVCGNHLDDNCDGFVDEGCGEKLTAGNPCGKAEDCLAKDLTLDDVECLKERRYWVFEDGYCFRKTNNATCPDGTKPFDVADGNNDNKYLCGVECGSAKACEREGYYCSNDVWGVCLPYCDDNDDCLEGYLCNSDTKKCERPPEQIGGSCDKDEDCIGDFSTCNTRMEGGYCTQECDGNSDAMCPKGSLCATTGRRQTMLCLASCSSDNDCRVDEGYLCHPQLGTKSGVCYRKCRGDSECNDENAYCNEDGYCAPLDWAGWPEEGSDDDAENSDSGEISDDDSTGSTPENEEDMTYDDDKPSKKKDSGCAVVVM